MGRGVLRPHARSESGCWSGTRLPGHVLGPGMDGDSDGDGDEDMDGDGDLLWQDINTESWTGTSSPRPTTDSVPSSRWRRGLWDLRCSPRVHRRSASGRVRTLCHPRGNHKYVVF